ncbi:MAG: formate--tetrahydrofolate ligase [Flavobacteriales bacterium]|nr:formate--tetrahydrofolate ligase [Flavobacteriales bacterium]
MKVRSPAQFSRTAASIYLARTMDPTSDHEHPVPRRYAFRPETLNVLNRAGAGFVVPICGEVMRKPGLPEVPAAEGMDIDLNGVIRGLS